LRKAAGELQSRWASPAKSQNGGLAYAKVVEQLSRGIRLVFWSDTGLKRRAEIARAGGHDDLETIINKKPGQRHTLIIAPGRIMKNQYRRAFAVADVFDRPVLGSDQLGCRIQVHYSRGTPGLEKRQDAAQHEEGQNNEEKNSAGKKSGFHNISVSRGG
jgi:hypothetical protein